MTTQLITWILLNSWVSQDFILIDRKEIHTLFKYSLKKLNPIVSLLSSHRILDDIHSEDWLVFHFRSDFPTSHIPESILFKSQLNSSPALDSISKFLYTHI